MLCRTVRSRPSPGFQLPWSSSTTQRMLVSFLTTLTDRGKDICSSVELSPRWGLTGYCAEGFLSSFISDVNMGNIKCHPRSQSDTKKELGWTSTEIEINYCGTDCRLPNAIIQQSSFTAEVRTHVPCLVSHSGPLWRYIVPGDRDFFKIYEMLSIHTSGTKETAWRI